MRLEAKAACVFLCQLVNSDIRIESRVYGCLRVNILLMVEMILNKNKNKNKKGWVLYMCSLLTVSDKLILTRESG